MNKRVLSLILMLCLFVSCFAGLSGGAAYAEGDTISYEVVKDDNLQNICKRFGLDFYQDHIKAALMKLNGFPDVPSMNRIKPGQVIILPSSDAAAKAIVGEHSATTVAPSGSASGVALSGDTVAYYLIAHTMQWGDTLYNVCNAYNVAYSLHAEEIMALNPGIKYVNRIPVGTVVYLPSATAPSHGNALRVMKHTVVAGDTMYDLCNFYGMSYNKNVDLISALNKGKDLTSIKTGQTVLIPATGAVAGSGSAAGTGTGGTGGTGSTGSGQKYKINIEIIGNGSAEAKVGGSVVTEAAAGASVSIFSIGNGGYSQRSIRVALNDGSAVLPANNNTFIMPKGAVAVTVTFSKARSITALACTNGSFDVQVNGQSNSTSAVFGKSVVVVPKPNNDYGVDTISYIANGITYTVAKSNGVYSFVMPDADVKIKVTFKKVQTYVITPVIKNGNGSVVFTIDGDVITQAAADVNVTVKVTPDSGYKVKEITIKDKDNNTVTYNKITGTFKMPAKSVTVTVELEEDSLSKYYSLGYSVVSGKGKVLFKNVESGAWVSTAKQGEKIQIVGVGDDGYVQDFSKPVSVRWADTSTNVTVDQTNYTFIMPAANIKAFIEFKMPLADGFMIYKGDCVNGSFITTVKDVDVYKATKDDWVKIVPKPATNYVLDIITICKLDGTIIFKTGAINNGDLNYNAATNEFKFNVAPYHIKIFVTFKFKLETSYAINKKAVQGSTNPDSSYKIFNDSGELLGSNLNAVKGTIITLYAYPAKGDEFVEFKVQNLTTFAFLTLTKVSETVYKFEMPESNVNVRCFMQAAPGAIFTVSRNSPENGNQEIKLEAGADSTTGTKLTGVTPGVTVTLTCNRDTTKPWELEKVLVDGTEIAPHSMFADRIIYQFTMPESNVSVEISYKKKEYPLTGVCEKGLLKLLVEGIDMTGDTVPWGEIVTIVVEPNDPVNFPVTSIEYSVNGGAPTVITPDSDGVYSFVMPKGNVKVTINF